MTSHLKPVLDSVRDAVKAENWLAALALTLTLPDICASIEVGSDKKVSDRYSEWWDRHFGRSYEYEGKTEDGTLERKWLSGLDVYCLRCAYLHQGMDSFDDRPAKPANFNFVRPSESDTAHHLQKIENDIQLDVRKFCEDICSKVEEWDETVLRKDDAVMQDRASKLMKIYALMPISAKSISRAEVQYPLVKDGRVLSRHKTG